MSTVTVRIRQIKQPRGGFIKPSEFTARLLEDDNVLNDEENVHGSVIGICVDYLTRFIMNNDKQEAFNISIQGAEIAETHGKKGLLEIAMNLLEGITGLDDESIINACKVVTFDVWKRNFPNAKMTKGYKETNPDESTIANIRILVNRSLYFFESYGPIVKAGFIFEPVSPSAEAYHNMRLSQKGSYGGYTPTVQTGDGDFLTKDTLWDFKVSKSKPTSRDTLQLLMYWIMGQHSGQDVFKSIDKLGIFNPRLNTVYTLDMKKVSKEIIDTVENDIICY